MEHRRHILPSNNYPNVSSDTQRSTRQPLGESSGNPQYSTLASSGLFHDQKPPIYQDHAPPKFPSLPTLPSQGPHHGSSQLGMRREQRRRHQQQHRGTRNPIYESSHYQAYRARQQKDTDGNQKWSPELEEAFLEALIVIPKMGRRKFSLHGKPHGRNELISSYLWIAYCESLPPGQAPDPSMRRTRKQVSSHIQVLKGFMRGHPQYDRLFLSKENPLNGFEDSFKNDPCLRSLAMNRLPPSSRPQRFDYVPSMAPTQSQSGPICPVTFLMSMTSPRHADDHSDSQRSRHEGETELVTTHEYCSSPLRNTQRDALNSVHNWRSKFPSLSQAHNMQDLKCELIHVDVSLNLRNGHMPEGSELWGSFEVHVPSHDDSDLRATWHCKSSLYKSRDLQGPADADAPYIGRDGAVTVERYEPGYGSNMRIPFPANPWAHALVKLAEMETQFDEAKQLGQPAPSILSARQYIEQISMYQELFSSPTPNGPSRRRAIIIWTFQKARAGDKGQACWRYLDIAPQRQQIFEPRPPPNHAVSSAMSENYGAYVDLGPNSQMHIQPPTHGHYGMSMPGVMTPPLTAHNELLQSQLANYGGSYAPGNHQLHDMSALQPESTSFLTNDTGDSDSTLVDNSQHTINTMSSQGYTHMGAEGVDLSFDGNIGGSYLPQNENFDGDASFLNNFGSAVPGHQGWDVNSRDAAAWDVGGELGNYPAMRGLGV